MPGKTILIVDDEAALLTMVGRLLANAGHNPCEANSLAAAQSLLKARPADLVLLDLFLDGENGWENIGRLRSLTRAPIVLMTGASVDQDTVKDARLLGAQGAIGKPFTGEELLAALAAAGLG